MCMCVFVSEAGECDRVLHEKAGFNILIKQPQLLYNFKYFNRCEVSLRSLTETAFKNSKKSPDAVK